MDNFSLLISSVSSLIKIADEARLICKQAGLLLQATNTEHGVAAVLELPRSSFAGLPLCRKTYVDGINLYDLQMTLAPSHREHAMYFLFNLQQRILTFTFHGPNNAVRNSEVQFIDPPIHANFAEAIYDFTVYVGIPSPTFQNIMSYLNGITADHKVVVSITKTVVRFASGNVAITRGTENGGCNIGGMEGRNGNVEIRICKFSINALLEASRLCATVWLFKAPSIPATDLVCCSVGLMGEMKFHYIPPFPIPAGPSYPPPKRVIPAGPSHPPPNPRTKRRKLQHGEG
ncbi:Protein diaphanous 1 like [Actinidia chinensis var. chinensis]|uniref:Protein diaphanous 1 like n=1 Tax=Actinidia chinensis var. chinensis TaxID=1590841 RepID=A0A2R6QKX5_ACTCC|nr:Protein diaphanous 1 like [Actinidia chinensis var. chinensis]